MLSRTVKGGRSASADQIRKQCRRLLQSRTFAQGQQIQKLLTFMVHSSLLGPERRITQAAIAREVLRADGFDPSIDSGVRRLAARLRERLRDYYAEEGRNDVVIFAFPKGQPYRLEATRRRSIEALHPLDDHAFAEYQRGRSLWAERTPESLRAAMDCFKRAIELFPTYSAAHSALGECYAFLVVRGAAPREAMPQTKTHALRALEIDDSNANAHALLGVVLCAYEWNWAAATREFERAISLDDKNPGTYCWYASHLVSLGFYDEAVRTVRLAQAAASTVPSALVNAHVAKIFLASGRYEDARSLLEGLQNESPFLYLTHLYLGVLEGIVGTTHSVAIESLERAAELSEGDAAVQAALGSVYARAGRMADAESVLSALLDERSRTYLPATDLASLCSELGQLDQAFEWLDHAVEERCLLLSWLRSWPPLRALSLDPRGKKVLRHLGLSR